MYESTRPITPAIGNTYCDWLKIRTLSKKKISLKYQIRVHLVGLINLLSFPFQYYEHLRLGEQIRHTSIHPAPVFIIGHWRSGTTFLHNLLSKDDQFGFITTLQSIFPHSHQTNRIFPFFTRYFMPPTRPMDNMKIYLESPQEEEMAMINTGPYSFYHIWHFPQEMRNIYKRLVRFEGITPEQKKEWTRNYLYLLRCATFRSGNRRLILKNPAHTARIPTLLNLFPDARFIYLERDPIQVYASTKKLYRNVLPIFQLQEVDYEEVRQNIIWIYRDLLTTYQNHRHLIPKGNLIEIRYEDLGDRPMEQVRRIYTTLDIGDFEKVRPDFERYLSGIDRKKKSKYDIPEEEVRELREQWSFQWR